MPRPGLHRARAGAAVRHSGGVQPPRHHQRPRQRQPEPQRGLLQHRRLLQAPAHHRRALSLNFDCVVRDE